MSIRRMGRLRIAGVVSAVCFGLGLLAAGSAAANTAYVTNFLSNSVTPIEVATNKAGAEIKVGEHPIGIAITPGPTSIEQCVNGGWKNYGSKFKNQGQREKFVETGR